MADAAGTVTFVFTDIEGSTKLLEELTAEPRRLHLERFGAGVGVRPDAVAVDAATLEKSC